MADVKTVKVQALQHHSYNGKDYQPGQTYDIDEQLVASVQAQGKAAPVDAGAHAKSLAKPAKQAPAAKAKKSKKR